MVNVLENLDRNKNYVHSKLNLDSWKDNVLGWARVLIKISLELLIEGLVKGTQFNMMFILMHLK